MTDQPTAVRKGEELPLDRLQAFLEKKLPGAGGTLTVRQFPGGFSNLTYLVHWGEKAFVLRRPPFGSTVKSAHDMGREHRILNALSKVWSKAPAPVLLCEDEAVLGAPFYLMERVEGVILRPKISTEQAPEPTLMRSIAGALTATLSELHCIDYQEIGLGTLGNPQGYAERQIRGWTSRYFQSKTDEIPTLEQAASWLAAHFPPENQGSKGALIHNDFKYDNLVLDPTDLSQVVGVLDWEMATLGDPLMDLGTTLGYWISPADPPFMQIMKLSPTTLPGNPTRSELVEMYARQSGNDPGDAIFYYVFGLFKVAVIIQQIYFRYKKGLTKDERFAGLIEGVKGCGLVARQAISRQRLDGLF